MGMPEDPTFKAPCRPVWQQHHKLGFKKDPTAFPVLLTGDGLNWFSLQCKFLPTQLL